MLEIFRVEMAETSVQTTALLSRSAGRPTTTLLKSS